VSCTESATSPLLTSPRSGGRGEDGRKRNNRTEITLTRILRRFLYIYSTYIYVQTCRLWKRGGLAADGITWTAASDAATKDGDEEHGGA